MIVAAFDTLEDAGKCVSELIATPLLPSATELMDRTCIRAVNKAINAGLPDCEALCMIEVDGDPSRGRARRPRWCEGVPARSARSASSYSNDPKQMAKWTNARKIVMSALSRYGESSVSVSLADDMAVPISRIPEAVVAFQRIAEENGVIIGTYGHAADGNLHTKMLLDPDVRGVVAARREGGGRDLRRGHHARRDGHRRAWRRHLQGAVPEEGEADRLATMLAIKKALDPDNILNPGKMMEWEGGIITPPALSLQGPGLIESSGLEPHPTYGDISQTSSRKTPVTATIASRPVCSSSHLVAVQRRDRNQIEHRQEQAHDRHHVERSEPRRAERKHNQG